MASTLTAWIKPAPTITGQDHLGTQAPCESIYVEQLRGITNVTSRARYFSFFPWFLREFERRVASGTAEDLVRYLRRAECLFALIGIRHGLHEDEDETLHGAGMVGREALVPALATDDGVVHLSSHAALESSKLRYFMNPLGGLGQYYLGPLRELGILGGDTRTRDIRYTDPRGLRLAETFAAGSAASKFFGLLEQDDVRVEDLDTLALFCPCGLLHSDAERRTLIEILLDPGRRLGDEARTRRDTLTLLLDLASRSNGGEYDLSDEFRAATYARTLVDGSPWALPASLRGSLSPWSVYTRNELLSIAFQGLFWAAITSAERSGSRRFVDPIDFASFATKALLPEVFDEDDLHLQLGDIVRRRSAKLPEFGAWTNDTHEIQAGWRITQGVRDDDIAVVARNAVDVLIALQARAPQDDPYLSLHFAADYFDRYPINLRSFFHRATERWTALSAEAVLREWLVWALRTHLRVAFQKLADANPRDTFKVRPIEGTLVVIEPPVPVFTVPRIHRAVGLLRDLRLLADDDSGRPILTTDGTALLEQLRG